MPGRTATRFLKRIVPFRSLDEPALSRFVEGLTLQLYPAGTLILRQGAPATGALYIVKEGVVRIDARTPAGEEQVLDFRTVGDTFGFLSLADGQTLDASVRAQSDAACYLADGTVVRRLLEERPQLREYLLPAYFPKREADLPWAALAGGAPHEGAEKALFTTPVGDLARRDVLTAGPGTGVREAARLMSDHRIGALVVVDDAGLPVGIVTNTDLRDKVLVAGGSPSTTVGEIMGAPPVCVHAGDFCFEALLKMMSHGVHHLPVLDGERLAGIVSSYDFLVLQGASPFVIAREIEGQATVEELAASSRRVKGLVSLLLREGAGAASITRVISAVNDRIEHRILDLAQAALGPPPLPYCWIVYGSAGRREQTFMTDQDNAIVYRDPVDEREEAAAREYFGRFAEFVVDAFLRCGFARCRGNFMASNPLWRQPLGTWKRSFSGWIRTPRGDAVFKAANFFDFRGLHGDLDLAARLKGHLLHALEGETNFLKAMADHAAGIRPAFSIFGSLVVERAGERANQLDVKKCCLMPLVNVVRLYSLESRVPETSTIERLAVLGSAHPVVRVVGDDLAHAFEFLSLLRIRHQHGQLAMDLEPDNYLQPGRLSSLEQKNLKQICRLLVKVIEGVQKRYADQSFL